MDQALRSLVRRRAGDICEYCRLPQSASRYIRFHIEHIVARQHGGRSTSENLALACSSCNFHKGPNIAGLDPASGLMVRLFDPRRDDWAEHFSWQRTVLIGLTDIGRATVEVLAMNQWQRLELRGDLHARGEQFAG